LKRLREEGWEAEKVEQVIGRTFLKRDLFNVIDIVAIREGMTLGVQATSHVHLSDHKEKCEAEPLLLLWLKARNRFQIWTWGKRKVQGLDRYTLKKYEAALAYRPGCRECVRWVECSPK